MTREECREFWRGTALAFDPEVVGDYLWIFAEDLSDIRQQTEALKNRPDISEEDRRIAQCIFAGLEGWSELIYDAAENQG